MSPLRPGRKLAAVLLLSTLSLAVALAAFAPTTLAQAPATPVHRVITVAVADCAGNPCWDTPTVVALPGDQVTLVADFTGQAVPHNLHVQGLDTDLKTPNSVGQPVMLNFTFPTGKKELTFLCDVHPKSMVGKIVIPSQLGAKEETAVPELGVHFLAYWVGVIAFMLLFLVYGLTFFLFKYNETSAATDHWDRTGGEGLQDNPKMRGGAASLIAIGVAIVVIAGIVYLARYLRS